MNLLKSTVKELGLENNVIITGEIKYANLIKSPIFKESDLFVTASLTETQGITILEAQANGLVCVGINAMGVRSLIKNGYNGYLVKNNDTKDFANKVIALLTNKTLYKKMQKNTLKEIKKHDMKIVIKTWEKEYSKLIKNEK